MPVFNSTEHLYASLRLLFDTIQNTDPMAGRNLAASRLLIRLELSMPEAQVLINGRQMPVKISYGSSALRPDLDVAMSADTLHQILLAELPLPRALANGQMRVRGPVWKTGALEGILLRGQKVYPQVLQSSAYQNPGMS